MPKKNITIDDLAGIVQRGFNDITDCMNQSFNNVDKKIEKLKTAMHDEFRRVHEEIEDIKKKLEQLSSRTMEDTDATIKEVFQLKKRIEILERNYRELKASIG